MKVSLKKIVLLSLILIVDVIVCLFLALMLMNYEDHYGGTNGEEWTLASMNSSEKLFFISYIIWFILNWIIIIYIAIKTFKYLILKIKK